MGSRPSRYPEASWLGNGQSGGAYTSGPWKVVLHTTETEGVPGYDGGATAPHLTYYAAQRRWVQHTSFLVASRALRNEAGGVQTNRDSVLQVEIVAYSQKSVTTGRPSRLWVGDLTAEQLGDIREFLLWASMAFGVKMKWPGKRALSYAEANTAGFRMSLAEWDKFDGVCAHQHVPENDHWDTGALDWGRLMQVPLNQVNDTEMEMLPIGPSAPKEVIRMVQERMSFAFGINLAESGVWDAATRAAVAKHLGPATGDKNAKKGDYINGRMYTALGIAEIDARIRRLVPSMVPSVKGAPTLDQIAAEVARRIANG